MPAVSVTACNLDRESTKMGTIKVGSAQLDSTVGGSYTLRYVVRTASAASPISVIVGGQTIGTGGMDQIPQLWSTYSYKGDTDAYSFCKSIDVERSSGSDTLYYVTCSFEPCEDGELPEGDSTPRDATQNPTSRPPRIWWDREVYSHIPTVDNAGKVITLPTKALYDDVIEKERTRAILVVEWNIGTFFEFSKLHQDYENSINDPNWNILGRTDIYPNTAVVRQISCSKVKNEGSHIYYTASMRFAFAETSKTWLEQMPLLARQYYKLGTGSAIEEESPGIYKRYSAQELVPINADGTRRPDNQDVAYANVNVYRPKNFNTLPFMALI